MDRFIEIIKKYSLVKKIFMEDNMSNRICFYSIPFPRVENYYNFIDVSAEYGFGYIEATPSMELYTPDIEQAKKIRAYADSKGIKIVCFSMYVNLVADNSEDEINKVKKYIDIADILGSPYIHHTIAGEVMNPDEIIANKDALFKKGIDAVREIYDYAESKGIKAIYEDQGFLFNGVEGMEKFLNTVNRDIGLLADFGNCAQVDENILGFIEKFGDRIVHAHLKDVKLTDEPLNDDSYPSLGGKYITEVKIGKGDARVKEAISLLENSGYKGIYSIEYSCDDDNSPDMKNLVTFFNSIVG